MTVPKNPKIYHIVHVDRLASIVEDGCLWCDAKMDQRKLTNPNIGMSGIKQRRLNALILDQYPDLHVGDCVPFYFCPRSIMLYVIYRGNHPEMAYQGGQVPILHLEADLHASVAWAGQNNRRWAFTLSNAGASYCEFRFGLEQLNEINWNAVQADNWGGAGVPNSVKEGKQAEFLLENGFPWQLVERIGVHSPAIHQQVVQTLPLGGHRPKVELRPEWYY